MFFSLAEELTLDEKANWCLKLNGIHITIKEAATIELKSLTSKLASLGFAEWVIEEVAKLRSNHAARVRTEVYRKRMAAQCPEGFTSEGQSYTTLIRKANGFLTKNNIGETIHDICSMSTQTVEKKLRAQNVQEGVIQAIQGLRFRFRITYRKSRFRL